MLRGCSQCSPYANSMQTSGFLTVTSANWVTIIGDYFYFNRLFKIIHDYFRVYAIFLLQKPKRLYAIIALSPKRWLFLLFHYDYFTYFFRHILLRSLRLYTIICMIFYRKLLYALYYLIWINRTIAIIFFRANYVHYAHYLSIIRFFFCLTIITIIFFQCYYTHYFLTTHYLHYINYGD